MSLQDELQDLAGELDPTMRTPDEAVLEQMFASYPDETLRAALDRYDRPQHEWSEADWAAEEQFDRDYRACLERKRAQGR